MTDSDARTIYRTLFTAFPQYREWLERAADDPDETMAVWRRMLVNVPKAAAVAAVDKMIAGELKMPEAYERDDLPRRIRSYAMRIEQDHRAKQRRERERSEMMAAKKQAYRYPMRELVAEGRELGEQLRSGAITPFEHKERMDDLKRRAAEKA